MRKYRNLYVLGTSHVAIESINAVAQAIEKLEPDIIALELDKQRVHALVSNKKRGIKLKDIRNLGFKGFSFNVIGAWIEKKLGKAVGTKPGDEMKKAIMLAKEKKIPVALIDQDVSITLRKLSKRLTWKEKGKFIGEAISAAFSKKNRVNIDLRKVPEEKMIKKMTAKVKKDYPSIYLTLIKERNEFMAQHLYKLTTTHEDKHVLAIVGAGHEKDIIEIIKCLRQKKKKETS